MFEGEYVKRVAMVAAGLGLILAGTAPCIAAGAKPAPASKPSPPRKADLADMLAGRWAGDVISDSKGSSRSGVTLMIERVGPNTVKVSSDYPRLPVITVRVERVMSVIMQASGNSTFLYDPAKEPPRLDVSFNNEVSWSGARE
jgi:hypothetical protein